MEFRILGPLEVVQGSRALPLGGAKQRALLAVLVLNANRAVSTEQLIDALWGEEPPDGAAHTVQVYVSQVRKALRTEDQGPGEASIVTQGRGYLLRVEPDDIDLQRFEATAEEGRRLLSRGDADRAAGLLREALDLWRGSALAELELEGYAQPFIVRIEDERLTAVEDRIDADLALGHHAELVGELRALVAENPLRERLRGQLMLALYRSGRQAEALQAYRDAKEMLSEELGIDPSLDLQRLERAILQQDPELDWTGVDILTAPGEPVERAAPRNRARLWIGLGVIAGLVTVAAIATLAAGGTEAAHPASVDPNGVGRIDAATDELVAAIPTTGTAPTAVVWADGSVWAANTVSRTVARIDPETDSVVHTVSTGGAPTDLTAADGIVWVLNGFDGQVQAIDPRTNEVTATIDVPAGSGGIAAGAGAVWVTNTLDATVTQIDPQTQEPVSKIRLGEPGSVSPKAIAVDGDRLWVGDELNPVLLVIDVETGEVVATPALRSAPTEIAVAEDGTVWVTSYDADLVSVVDPSTLQATTIEIGRGPMGLSAGAGGVWVANSGSGSVSRIDPRSRKVVETIRIGPMPEGVAFGGGSVWVSVHA